MPHIETCLLQAATEAGAGDINRISTIKRR